MLLSELTDAVQRGQTVELEAVCRQHPDLADELRQLWARSWWPMWRAATPTAIRRCRRRRRPAAPWNCRADWAVTNSWKNSAAAAWAWCYRARQLGLDREVAVKMILRGQLASAADRERFRAEAEAAARLDHPNIVPVYEVGESEGRPFFSMKYIAGRTLSQMLTEHPLPARDAARIMATVSRAIHFAHQKGVLHRDLKPSNILIDADRRAARHRFRAGQADDGAGELDQVGGDSGHAFLHGAGASGRGARRSRCRPATCTAWEPCCTTCSPAARRFKPPRRSTPCCWCWSKIRSRRA